jgi:two-component system chemotaxis response regulator CheB
MNHLSPIQVMVVDDSAVVRQVMQAILSREPDMVVTIASDPLIAMQKMKQTRPHVVLLDLEMPRMDGLTFLRKIMSEDPIPTLVCSGVADKGTRNALLALDEGAVGIVSKPKIGVGTFLHDSALMLIDMVRAAAHAHVKQRSSVPDFRTPQLPLAARRASPKATQTGRIVAIGASTGGTEALTTLLSAMPADAPGIVIVQHMPELFTAAFARRLNDLCQIEVKEGAAGDLVVPGRVIIAPGNRHLAVIRNNGHYQIDLSDGPLVSRHRPSVDILFRSVASAAGAKALGIILTGMGKDGAAGMLAMKHAGSRTVAQDEDTCVVFGMPKEAIAAGAVDSVSALDRIPNFIMDWALGG